jgi:hypothetical protein
MHQSASALPTVFFSYFAFLTFTPSSQRKGKKHYPDNNKNMSSLDTALLSAEQAKVASSDSVRVVVVSQSPEVVPAPAQRRRRGNFCCLFLVAFFMVSYFTWPRIPRATWVSSTFTLSIARPPLSMEHTYSVTNRNFAQDTLKNLEVVQYYCASADRVDMEDCRMWTPIGGAVSDDDESSQKIKARSSKLMTRTFYFAEVERGTLLDLQQQCYGENGVLMLQQGVVHSKRMGTVPLERQVHIQQCIAEDAPADPDVVAE